MNSALFSQYALPALIAGIFSVVVAFVTAKLTAAADRRKFEREERGRIEGWHREFASRYAEVRATNPAHAEALRQQFAAAVLWLRDPNTGESERRFIPSGASVTVGRGPACDLILPDDAAHSVSRHHATIRMVGDELWVTDLQSTAGTWLDGAPISQATRLHDGARLRFGNIETIVQLLDKSGRDSERLG